MQSLDQIRRNLTDRGIYPSFLLWWNDFWGLNGLGVQYFAIANQTDPSQINNTTPINFNELVMSTIVNGVLIENRNIPPELQKIVNFVTALVN